MTRPPDFGELIGEDASPDERERLRRVHDLLVAAGPPPEIPPALASPPRTTSTISFLPRRRRAGLLVLAAALAAAAFGAGDLVADRDGGAQQASRGVDFDAIRIVQLHGTAAARDAQAVVRIGRRDGVGNWPMLVTLQGLGKLGADDYYRLALTKNGKPVVTCGTFNVRGGYRSTTVRMSAAYQLEGFDGWVVTEYKHGRRAEPVVLTT